MSHEADIFTSSPGGRRERPWLLASNRKLRHLQGISVRNLAISATASRPRGKTIDDDNLPYTLKSPAKLLAQSETRGLQHSRSSTDLTSSSKSKLKPPGSGPATSEKLPQRPSAGRLRRRSTLQWTGASPRTRQKKLEDVAEGRMVDTWFSLHVQGVEEPIYISEVIEKAMNPSFRFFDLNSYGPLVSRLDEITIKFWAKTESSKDWTLLVELQLNLRSLQFIGKNLENFRHPLPPNCLIFHLTDGIYTSFTDLPPEEPPVPFRLSDGKKSAQDGVQFTSSYDALMRLANLDDCIQDALATREKLETQINAILSSNRASILERDSSSLAREELSSTKRAVAHEKRQLRATAKRREDLKNSLRSRRDAMSQGREIQSKAQSHLAGAQSNLADRDSLVTKATDDSRGQIRRICEELLSIYPIDPIPGKHYCFTIRSLYLPNSSSFEDADQDTIAASLGYVAHMVYLLSFYLSVPLPFPIKPFSSRSFIQDPIASTIPPTQRIYPLYPGVQFRFDYGVFLLNKDIEVLLSRQGLRISDPRHTLPNLKYLLFVLTAGTGDLPARKAGGVRGLLTGRATPTTSLSRRGSEDSMKSADGTLSRKVTDDFSGQMTSNGGLKPSKGKEEDLGKRKALQASSKTSLPFKGSGLRETVQ